MTEDGNPGRWWPRGFLGADTFPTVDDAGTFSLKDVAAGEWRVWLVIWGNSSPVMVNLGTCVVSAGSKTKLLVPASKWKPVPFEAAVDLDGQEYSGRVWLDRLADADSRTTLSRLGPWDVVGGKLEAQVPPGVYAVTAGPSAEIESYCPVQVDGAQNGGAPEPVAVHVERKSVRFQIPPTLQSATWSAVWKGEALRAPLKSDGSGAVEWTAPTRAKFMVECSGSETKWGPFQITCDSPRQTVLQLQ